MRGFTSAGAPNNTAAASRIIKRTDPGRMSDYGRALAREIDGRAYIRRPLICLAQTLSEMDERVQLASTAAPAAATSQVKR